MTTLDQGRSDNLRRFHCRLVVLLLFFATQSGGAPIKAAPITFAFDAEVMNVLTTPAPDFNLPFEVHVGDTIHGRFTFEPSPIGHLGPQDLGVQFEIGGTTLVSPTYEIGAALHETTRPPSEFVDTLSVECFFLPSASQCSPGTVPGTTNVRWWTFMQLSGTSPILDHYYLPGDLDTWNSFTGRSVELHFSSASGGMSVGAIADPLQVVPEPGSLSILSFAPGVIYGSRRASRRRIV